MVDQLYNNGQEYFSSLFSPATLIFSLALLSNLPGNSLVIYKTDLVLHKVAVITALIHTITQNLTRCVIIALPYAFKKMINDKSHVMETVAHCCHGNRFTVVSLVSATFMVLDSSLHRDISLSFSVCVCLLI